MYLVMARTGGPGPKGISAFLVEKVKAMGILYQVSEGPAKTAKGLKDSCACNCACTGHKP